MSREGGLPQTLAVVVYNGGERWTAIGEESHLAQVPSARARRDLALLQPQLYRRVDTAQERGAGLAQEQSGGGDRAAAERRHAGPDWAVPVGGGAALCGAGTARVSAGDATLGRRRRGQTRWGRKRPFRPLRSWSRRNKRWQPSSKNVGQPSGAEERELGRELGLAEGRELGLVQGRELGRADERTRLRRQAALKFGAGTAARLADRLADLTAFEDLDRVADWIIECESGDELLSRLHFVASA